MFGSEGYVAAMAGCSGVAANVRIDKCPCRDCKAVSFLTERLVAVVHGMFRVLQFWTPLEVQCMFEGIPTVAKLLELSL
jgi:hypothetical protein